MERITISLDAELAHEFDRLIAVRGYKNRSEAMRDMLRNELEQHRFAADEAKYCIANLSYVYNHHERTLAERLTQLQHDHHDLTVSSMHAHLDHEHCIESVFLRGPTAQVRQFANALSAESGVRHGQLNLVSLEVDQHAHTHPYRPAGSKPHVHMKPKS